MGTFREWLQELSDTALNQLQSLLRGSNEVGGYIQGDNVVVLSRGFKGGVNLGNASQIRQIECDFTFHTHPNKKDVPYPSAKDVVGIYKMGKPDLTVTLEGIWKVVPLKTMSIEEVDQISQQAEQESNGDYDKWKQIIEKQLPVKITSIS